MQPCDPHGEADPGERAPADERETYSPRRWLKVREIRVVCSGHLLASHQGPEFEARDIKVQVQPLQRIYRHGHAAERDAEVFSAGSVCPEQIRLVPAATEQERDMAWWLG